MNEAKPIKNFKNLIEEVHDKGICQLCGGCVSFCSSADYKVIDFIDPNLPPQFINEENCLECGICYHICPQTHVLEDELNKHYKFIKYIGNYDGIYSCQALDEEILNNGTDGGVVSALLLYLLEKKLIEGAIVSRKIGPFARDSMIAQTKNDLLSAAGAILDVAPQVTEIANYTTYSPTIIALNRYKFKKLAVIGTPCQLYTVRCMQNLGVTPSQNIEICLGLFCYENFSFESFKKDDFKKDFNVNFEDIKKINIKEDLIFTLKDDSVVHIPFNQLNDYMRPACKACYDFANFYADISFGGLGSPDKYTTVIPRTVKGKKLFLEALNSGIIKCLDLDETKKKAMKDIIVQYSQMKIKRKENFINNLI
jgi:coenzyme F420 hydrogenase subunit beta